MKNVIAFFALVGCLFSLKLFSQDDFNFDSYSKVVLVFDEKLSEEVDFVQSGNEFYYSWTDKGWEKYESQSKALVFYFDKFDFNSFSKRCDEINRCDDIDGMKIYEGFYGGYNNSVIVSNKKVNFQLAIKEDEAVLGFPMIVVGF